MAFHYTYDDFQKAVASSGVTFSDADTKLAQRNPDAGMSLLQYKQDYRNATTEEARALAHLGAEKIRNSYGGYTGGVDGGSFALTELSPIHFSAANTPTDTNSYDSTLRELLDKQLHYGSFTNDAVKPEYTNRYDQTTQELLNTLLHQKEFSYDASTDPLYSQYRKQYAREGQRAAQDALGTASAASGGLPSSYAVSAAAQAGNYYSAQMSDKIPELYQLAYQQYLNEYDRTLSRLSAVQGAEQSDYQKYLNDLNQYNTDRNFNYQTWTDGYSRLNNDLVTVQGQAQSDYNRYLKALDQYNTERSFQYSQFLDELNHQTNRREETVNNAQLAAQYGDYSGLNALGIDTSDANADAVYQRQYELALLAAEYGDFSLLQKLGITPDADALYRFQTAASGKTYAAGRSSGRSSGGAVSDAETTAVPVETPVVDTESVLALGYGPINGEMLNTLVENGDVVEYVENGVLKFRRRESRSPGTNAGVWTANKQGNGGVVTTPITAVQQQY